LAALVALPVLPASAAPLCDYVSYIVKDGRCIDISEGSWRGAYGRYVDDVTAQNEPLIVQNLRARTNTLSDGKTFLSSTFTGQFVNRSRRTLAGGVATISIYRGDRLTGAIDVEVNRPIPPGGTASFEQDSQQYGGKLIAESVEPIERR
jgi:hypothetical protein